MKMLPYVVLCGALATGISSISLLTHKYRTRQHVVASELESNLGRAPVGTRFAWHVPGDNHVEYGVICGRAGDKIRIALPRSWSCSDPAAYNEAFNTPSELIAHYNIISLVPPDIAASKDIHYTAYRVRSK